MPKDFYIDKTDSKYSYRQAEEEDELPRLRKFVESENGSDEGETEEQELPRRTLRRRGDAKPPRKPNVPIGMVKCPICDALVPKSRLDEHMQKNHTEQPEDEETLDRCPDCDVEVRSDRLDKHLRKVHPDY
jgi:hypothetical protein